MNLTLEKLLDILDAYSQVSETGLPLPELPKVAQVAIAIVQGKSLKDLLKDHDANELVEQVKARFDPELALLKILDPEKLALGQTILQQVQRIRQSEDLAAETLLEAMRQISQLLPDQANRQVAIVDLARRVIQRVALLKGLDIGHILEGEVLLKYKSLAEEPTRSPQQHARELADQITHEVTVFREEQGHLPPDLTEPIVETAPADPSSVTGLTTISVRSQLTSPTAVTHASSDLAQPLVQPESTTQPELSEPSESVDMSLVNPEIVENAPPTLDEMDEIRG